MGYAYFIIYHGHQKEETNVSRSPVSASARTKTNTTENATEGPKERYTNTTPYRLNHDLDGEATSTRKDTTTCKFQYIASSSSLEIARL